MKKKTILALSIFTALTLTACNIIPDMNFGPNEDDSSETNSESGSSSGSNSSSSSSSSGSSSSSSTPATVKLSSITISGQKTDYEVGDDFVMPTVTAHYSDSSTKNVTASATQSGFNSAVPSASQKITISYKEKTITKTASYYVTITAKETSDSIINTSGKSIKLYYGIDDYDNPEYLTTTVYFSENTVDVPYSEFKGFYEGLYLPFVGGTGLSKTNPSTGVYRYSNSKGYFEINCSADTIFVSNPSNVMFALDKTSSGVSYLVDGHESGYISISNKSSTKVAAQNLTLNLKEYGIDIIEYNSSAYVPTVTLCDMLTCNNIIPVGYNGKDLYYSGAIYGDLETMYYNDTPWSGLDTRSETIASYTYNELCFNIDNFYGLKDVRSITKIDTIIAERGWKTNLLSTDTQKYEIAMQQFIGAYFCDGHSGYTATSPFQKDLGTSAYDTACASNERETALMNAAYQCYYARKGAGKTVGVSFEGNTAIITFDHFTKRNSTYGTNVDTLTYAALDNSETGDSYLFFKKAFKEITAKGSTIKKVVIDVTNNGGGAVDSIPWLEAFMTDDPFISFKNAITGEVSDVHYSVDLDMSGSVTSADTYKDQYDFYILTSNFSFSCANAFPTMAKAGGMAKIIGQQSGGGACCVGGFFTGSGTVIRSSSPFQFGTYSGSTWTDNDSGVPVDYSMPLSDFYNDEAICTFVNAH